ncbi:MAG: hypothetical protein ABFS56_16235 [Pseudomonadota bacterium]
MQVAHSGVNIIILDACRDSIPDDFFNDGENKGAFKGLGTGLTQMNVLRGSLIAYSTAPNTTRFNSPPPKLNLSKHSNKSPQLSDKKRDAIKVSQALKKMTIVSN